jgi:hypothetical protein
MRALRSSLLKLSHRPATGRTFLVLAAFLALIYVSLGLSSTAVSGSASRAEITSMLAFPDAHGALAGMLLIFGGIAGAAYAGAVIGSEWTWNTFRVAVARGASRAGYVLGLFVAVALLALVAWLVLYALGVVLVLAADALAGTQAGNPLDPASLGQVALLVAAGGWAVLMEVAIGYAAAFVARSQLVGVATVVGLFFAERFAEIFVPPDLLRLAPITAASDLVTAASKGGLDASLIQPLAVTALYVFGALGIAAFVARRSEVA